MPGGAGAAAVGGGVHAVPQIRAPGRGGMPEVDVERREGETRHACQAGRRHRGGIGHTVRKKRPCAIRIGVEHRQLVPRRVEGVERAAGVDREQRVLESPAVEILRPDRQARELCRGSPCVENGRRGEQRRRGGPAVDREDVAMGVDAVERAVDERHPRDDAERVGGILDVVALAAPGLARRHGGRTIGGIRPIEPRCRSLTDGVEEEVVLGDVGPAPREGVHDVGRHGLGIRRVGVPHRRERRTGRRRIHRRIPGDRHVAGRGIHVADAIDGRGYSHRSTDRREGHGPGDAGGEVPRPGGRHAADGGRVGNGAANRARHDVVVGEAEDRRRHQAEGGRPDVVLRDRCRCRRIRDRIVADEGPIARPGIHQFEHSRGVVDVGRQAGVVVEFPVRPHRQVTDVLVGVVVAPDHRFDAAPHGVDRPQARGRGHEERDVGERERRDMRRECDRIADVDQRSRGRRNGGTGWIGRGQTARVARVPDVVLHDPLHGIHGLEPDQGIRGAARERRVERGGQPLVARDRDVIPELLRRIRGGDRAAGLQAARSRGSAGRQLHRADEWIELARRAGRRIGERRPALVARHVGIAAHVDQLAGRIEHRDREVAPEPVAVVDVEDGRPALAARVHARDALELLVVERERVPVDVGRRRDRAGHADGGLVRLEDVPQWLGVGEHVVGGGALARLAGEQRPLRQAQHVDAHLRITDGGIADRRARLLVALLEPHAQLVRPARRPRGHLRGVDEVGLVGGLRRRGVVPRLAADADEVLVLGARRAGQDHPHAGVLGVHGVEVAPLPRVLAQILADAPRAREESRVGLGIGRPGPNRAAGIQQFDHHVEPRARLVEVDPHLGAAVAGEAVHVHVAWSDPRDRPVHLESEPPGVVAALAVGGEHAEHLGGSRRGVGLDPARRRGLRLLHDRHVRVVGEWEELQAPPVARGGRGGGAVGVGVFLELAERVEARPHRIVLERGEDHGIAGLADHLHRAADPVGNVGAVAGGGEAGIGSGELHDEAGGRLTHEPEARRRLEVADDDLAQGHVDDVGVVPDGLGGDLLPANLHPLDRAAGGAARRR